jgi:hypothetical protein
MTWAIGALALGRKRDTDLRMAATNAMARALAIVALAGCRRGGPSPSDAAAEAESAPVTAPAAGADAEPLAVTAPVFVPQPDGGVSEVLRKDAPNMRYAALGRDTCLAELRRRAIVFEEVASVERSRSARTAQSSPKVHPKPPTKKPLTKKPPKKPPPAAAITSHVLAPVRLRGPLHGVAIQSALPERQRATSTIEVFDCRLVLALDDFAALLAEHHVTEIVHMSAYRSEADRGCTPKYVGKQHCAALAVDVGVLAKSDGTDLDVERDFNGKIGQPTCTAGAAPNPPTPAAKELWSLVCDAASRGLFHVILTPNYNEEHKNHLHLEITPDVAWMLVH